MTTIKFSKSVKYNGVRYAAHEAFKVADEEVEELKKQGATVLSVEAPAEPEVSQEAGEDQSSEESDEDVAQLKEDLLSYSVADLIKFAKSRDIDLQGKTRKADVYNVIVASLN